jgi:hypothetical protein
LFRQFRGEAIREFFLPSDGRLIFLALLTLVPFESSSELRALDFQL